MDQAALSAEAQAIAQQLPDAEFTSPATSPDAPEQQGATSPATSQPAQLDPATKAADIEPVVNLLVHQACDFIAPNWQVTGEERAGLSQSLALVLAYWVPDTGIDPKYIALVSLAGSAWAIASKRRQDDGTFRPLRAKPPKQPAEHKAAA